jgi:uncharacterized protein (DUF1684 family)
LWLSSVIVAVAGCSGPGAETMTSVPPPSGWEERLIANRAERDVNFREDPNTPLLPEDLLSFEGLEYWDPDPEYRLVGPLEIYDDREQFEIPTTTGKMRPCERYGRVTFELDGRTLTLQVYRLLDSTDESGLFLPFIDGTTGRETYPAGRYIDLDGETGGVWVLDFNRAYNPLCAYGDPERYFCPVTPPENRLDVRIEAGERGYKKG